MLVSHFLTQAFEKIYKNYKLSRTNSVLKKKKKRIYDFISIIRLYSVSSVILYSINL